MIEVAVVICLLAIPAAYCIVFANSFRESERRMADTRKLIAELQARKTK